MALFRAIRQHDKAIAVGRISKFFTFRFVPTSAVFSDKVVVYVANTPLEFAILSSAIHSEWALEWGTTHGAGTPNYKPTECGRTFPFPAFGDSDTSHLAAVGESLNDLRESLFRARRCGPTTLYNHLHDPHESEEDIQRLRQVHVELDRAVVAAYAWSALDLGHGFHDTKQGTRFTISQSARREVLARLLTLNHERYAEEVKQGLHDKCKKKASRKRTTSKQNSDGPELFD
jgi:hypothetical protein